MAPALRNRTRARRAWVVAALAGAALVAWTTFPDWGPSPLRPDPGAAWELQFGRGSGLDGLDTVKVRSDGAVTLHRPDRERNDGSWETAGMTLPPAVVAEVLDAVRRHRLLGLRQAYHADVHDGSQWVFLFRQGGSSKAVYFDNSFPKAIVRFAEDLDRILAANGLGAVAWRRVPLAEARGHERELWESVRQ